MLPSDGLTESPTEMSVAQEVTDNNVCATGPYLQVRPLRKADRNVGPTDLKVVPYETKIHRQERWRYLL